LAAIGVTVAGALGSALPPVFAGPGRFNLVLEGL
jgi:hypothetical protein